MTRLYLMTEQQHAQIVDALEWEVGGEPCGGQAALAMLKAMQPVSPVGCIANYGSKSGSLPEHAGEVWFNGIPAIGTNLYALEQSK